MAEQLEQVGVREFDELTDQYIADTVPIALTRDGRVVGFYVPVPPNRKEAARVLQRIAREVELIRKETGLSEDELADLFDLKKLLPE